MTDIDSVVDLEQTKKRGRPKKDYWFRKWKTEKRDAIHKLVSRFHGGDDTVIPLLASLGIKAKRQNPSEEKDAMPEVRE